MKHEKLFSLTLKTVFMSFPFKNLAGFSIKIFSRTFFDFLKFPLKIFFAFFFQIFSLLIFLIS